MNHKLYQEYGLTDDDWHEIVDFFYQMFLMVRDAEARKEQRHRLIQILYGHVQKQISERKKILQYGLSGLELLTERF